MRRRSPTSTRGNTATADMGSLGRGLDILRNLGTLGSVITVADLAAQSGSSRVMAERLLRTLASEGFLNLIPGRENEGAYEPDLACLTLGTALLSSFSELWQRQSVLQDIARRFSVDVLVATRDGTQALIIEHAACAVLQQTSLVGSAAPMESNAWGRCLVWMHESAEQASLIDGIRRVQGSRAMGALSALYQAFQGLEESGCCMTDFDDHSVEIGIPVRAARGSPFLAIGCVAPRVLLADALQLEALLNQLRSLVRQIGESV